jgi:hypothetical protein
LRKLDIGENGETERSVTEIMTASFFDQVIAQRGGFPVNGI